MLNNIRKNQILEQYLSSAVATIKNKFIVGKKWSIRCELCGDSASEPRVRSAGLVYDKDHWYYKCFRSGCIANEAISGEKFLKLINPNLYDLYINDLKLEYRKECYDKLENKIENKIEKKIEKEVQRSEEKVKKKDSTESKDIMYFKKINGSELSKLAIDFLNRKCIPECFKNDFYVAEGGTFSGRLIIPLFDENEEIIFWQARDLKNTPQKYLNRIGNKSEYVWIPKKENWDIDKPIMVCEGIFSAMSVENGIAVLGSVISDKQNKIIETLLEKNNNKSIIYLFDDDSAGKNALRKLLKQGKMILNWNKLKRESRIDKEVNDMNDLMVILDKRITSEYLNNYLTDSFWDVTMI